MRKAILGALLFFAPALHAQVTAPTIILVGSAPSGSCSNNLPDRQVASTGILYSCQSGTWTQIGAAGSGAGIGNIFGSMIQSVARQPELRGELQGLMWLGFALTEAVVFYGFLGGLLGYVLV